MTQPYFQRKTYAFYMILLQILFRKFLQNSLGQLPYDFLLSLCDLRQPHISGDLILKMVPFLDPLTKLMFLLPKNKYTQRHLKILQILLYTTSLWILCSLPSCIFKTKLELPLCLFFMILSYYLCLLFAEIYIFFEMFF